MGSASKSDQGAIAKAVGQISLGTWITLATMVFGGGATYATITANDSSLRRDFLDLRSRVDERTAERKAEDLAIRAELKAQQERTSIINERVSQQQTQVIERLARVETSLQTLISLFERDRRANIGPFKKTTADVSEIR